MTKDSEAAREKLVFDAVPLDVLILEEPDGSLRRRRSTRGRQRNLPRQGTPYRIVSASENKVDRKSTRLNSSHPSISYAVFCLKKKKKKQKHTKIPPQQ